MKDGWMMLNRLLMTTKSYSNIIWHRAVYRHSDSQGVELRHPRFFMSDYSEAELLAVESVFQVYLCDFHREQAWLR